MTARVPSRDSLDSSMGYPDPADYRTSASDGTCRGIVGNSYKDSRP